MANPSQVRADVRAFLDMMAANPRPAFTDEFVAMMRQAPPELMAAMDLPVGEMATIRDLAAPGPAGDIPLRLYDPRATRGPGPVVVFFHGGGFVAGGIDTHAGLAAAIARELDLPVVSVEYRLAPEAQWPAAPDDAEAAARWVAENGAALDREVTDLILCGDSAGGTLTLVTAIALRDQPAARPLRALLPIYPKADSRRPFGEHYASHTAFSAGYGLDLPDVLFFEKAYAADGGNWRHSPIVADLIGLPPILLCTAECDPLRDEGRAFAAAAVQAGVDVTYREYPGTIHGFCSYRKLIPSAQPDLLAYLALAKAMIAAAG